MEDYAENKVVKAKKKPDPRDPDFVNVYDKQLFSKGEEQGGSAEVY